MIAYLSAGVEFLNRDSQEISKALMYPITKVTLIQHMDENNPTGEPRRTFVVGDNGEWIELL